jgi:hypothetical protein
MPNNQWKDNSPISLIISPDATVVDCRKSSNWERRWIFFTHFWGCTGLQVGKNYTVDAHYNWGPDHTSDDMEQPDQLHQNAP